MNQFETVSFWHLSQTTFIIWIYFLNYAEICSLEVDMGEIPGPYDDDGFYSYHFYYDKSAGTCRRFKRYNGGGNANCFSTFEECMKKCKGVK